MKLAIITLDPCNGGGVLHTMLAYRSILKKHLESTTVLFLSFNPKFATSIKRLRFSSKVGREDLIENLQISNGEVKTYQTVSIGTRWSFFEPWHYSATIDHWERELKGFDKFFVTSGTAIAAHALSILGKEYSLSFASDFAGDRAYAQEPNILRTIISNLSYNSMLKIEKQCLSNALKLLPMSKYALNKSNEILGKKNKKATIIGYPVFHNNDQYKALESTKDQNLFVSIGRFTDPRKNIELLLQAWQIVSAQLPRAKLVLIGEMPKSSIMGKYSTIIDNGNLVLLPNASKEQKFFVISKSLALIISSHQEGLGITGLEAGMCKTAVISTRCGGPEDYIIDQTTGIFVEQNNPKELANTIISAFMCPKLMISMGLELYSLVQSQYNSKIIEERLVASVLNSKIAHPAP